MKRSAATLVRAFLLAGLTLCPLASWGVSPSTRATPQAVAPVIVYGRKIFDVQGILSFPAPARAAAISSRIEGLSKDVRFKPESLSVVESEGSANIMAGDVIVMSVTDEDASAAGEPRQQLAQDYAKKIAGALAAYRHAYSVKSLVLGGVYAIVCTVVLLAVLRLIGLFFPKIYRKLRSWRGTVIPSLRIQKFEILPSDRIAAFAVALAKLLRLALTLVLLYFYASLVLGFFPWTRGYAQVLLVYVLSPLKLVGDAVRAYLPSVFFIAVICLISFYVIRGVRIIFGEIGKQTITFRNFYPEWAEPTYKIVRLFILVITAIVIFPYLPGAKSPAFRGISIFLGVLFFLDRHRRWQMLSPV